MDSSTTVFWYRKSISIVKVTTARKIMEEILLTQQHNEISNSINGRNIKYAYCIIHTDLKPNLLLVFVLEWVLKALGKEEGHQKGVALYHNWGEAPLTIDSTLNQHRRLGCEIKELYFPEITRPTFICNTLSDIQPTSSAQERSKNIFNLKFLNLPYKCFTSIDISRVNFNSSYCFLQICVYITYPFYFSIMNW